MKKQIALIMLICAGIFLSGCGSNTPPAKTVTDFYTFLDEGKIDAAFELIDEKMKSQFVTMGNGDGVKIFKTVMRTTFSNSIKEVKIIKEDISGDTATVQFVIEMKNNRSKEETQKLIKENGKWRIKLQ